MAESFTGFSKLKKDDKDLMKSKLGSGGGKKGKGGKRKAPALDETDAKRMKTAEEDEVEKQLKVLFLVHHENFVFDENDHAMHSL